MAKNIPRIYLNAVLHENAIVPIEKDVSHYLKKVMRTNNCLVFNSGTEYAAQLSDDCKSLVVGDKTNHADYALDVTFYFSVIKNTDDLLNMITQMGVARIQPVITERTVARHINWKRINKIITEAAEQSGRNSLPEILPIIKFADLDKSKIVFADERKLQKSDALDTGAKHIMIGPEGGFSDAEFEQFDAAGANGVSLGGTILRAEVAGVVMCGKMI